MELTSLKRKLPLKSNRNDKKHKTKKKYNFENIHPLFHEQNISTPSNVTVVDRKISSK